MTTSGELVRGASFSVIGAARSGVAVARLLHTSGARVFVSDAGTGPALAEAVRELQHDGIPCELGGHTARVADAETIVVSPGVPSDAPVVQNALAQGRRVVSELEVAGWFCRAPIVAVTGTNGKTTTTTLLGRMFADAGRHVLVAGNIGMAFSQVVGQATPESVVVLEVSSFQLDHVDRFRPRIALVLNFTPDHLNRYEHSYEKYIAAKMRIVANQDSGDTVIFNADDAEVRTRVQAQAPLPVRRCPFTLGAVPADGAGVEHGMLVTMLGGVRRPVIETAAIGIRGAHNLMNAMAAVLAAQAMGVGETSLRGTLAGFSGVEHRLETVRELNGVTYVNDSKATNVDSVWYALQSFRSPLVVLMGGRDKGNDYSRLFPLLDGRVRAIVAIGESADTVVAAFSGRVQVLRAGSMEEAVRTARGVAHPGDVVLLSPACASFDWFTDYEHRGRAFKEIVRGLAAA